MKNLIPAIIIAAAIIIYGFMQMYISNAQRYQFHESEHFKRLDVFDKRTGRIYHTYGPSRGSYYDAVSGENTRRSVRTIAPETEGE